MNVDYINHMGTDMTVVNAARVSFNKTTVLNPDGSLNEKDKKLISYLASHNHWTPFSHPQITMREKVPIFVARQRFKHMIGFSYNEISRRYVDEKPEFFNPDAWRKRPDKSIKQGSGEPMEFQEDYDHYHQAVITSAMAAYDYMIYSGVAPEQARMVLPQSMYTEYYVTGSLAAWARAYKLRIDNHAQKEIQDLAKMWDKIIQPLFPESWKTLTEGK